MVGRLLHLLILFILSLTTLFAQVSEPPKRIHVARTTADIQIDGQLRESVWARAGFTAFTQALPNEGNLPSQRTEVWLAYDDEALYVAARMHDSAPDSIIQILGRRDAEVTADWFEFDIDPYHDHRTGFYFALSAAGSMRDGTLYNDDWDDDTWDGVWEGIAHIDSEGWSVELRIPYTQLRFTRAEKQMWGVNFKRTIGRSNEKDYVVFTPQQGSGYVSRFVDAEGIENVATPMNVEVLPYLTTRAEYSQHAQGDPFNDGSKYAPGLGADFKVALGSGLTLNGTLNPDFGQVEVDPAVVNLSDTETYFEEKRPFFIEGANIFKFGYGGSNNNWGFNWGNPSFVYSRRIGRTPQGDVPANEYADMPLGTHIIGAGKITGKMGGDWNVGMIHALTSREYARIQSSGTQEQIEVEPLTYYGVARAQKDFDDGRQGVGFITTFTNRFFSDDRLRDAVNSRVVVGGIDGWQFLDSSKTYVVTGWGAFSSVAGSTERVTSLQRNSRHYFQRPGLPQFALDSSATGLTGYGARFALNKQKGAMQLNAAIGVITPGFDVDDLGYAFGRTDVINYHIVTGYKWTERTEYYNNVRFDVAFFGNNDFGGNKIWQGTFLRSNIEFPNFYKFSVVHAYNPYTVDTRSTRGGPPMLNPIGREWDINFGTDSRKPIVMNMYGFTYLGGGGEQFELGLDCEFKPLPNILLSIGPAFSRRLEQAQWVGSYTDPTAIQTYGSRYVFADFDQKTISANIRLNWTFTPQLSLQFFLQPLLSSGDYHGFKYFAKPRTYNFDVYGRGGSSITPDESGLAYSVDADGAGPAPGYTFSNPNFTFASLRGNAVLRWEYRPGSTLYLVWTQSRSDNETIGNFQFGRSMNRLWDAKSDNIFMLKFTYWWTP